MSNKLIFQFSQKKTDGDKSMVGLLGGKGANLAEMSNLGVNVPPGFTITTEVCNYYIENNTHEDAVSGNFRALTGLQTPGAAGSFQSIYSFDLDLAQFSLGQGFKVEAWGFFAANANAKQFSDTVVHNGTGANSYDWSWSAIDGSGSTTSQTLGSNLLGAELILQFPTDDYEPLTTTEIEEINNQLNTINLNENEIWDVISEIESQIETEIYELTATPVSVSLEESFQISIYEPQQQIEASVIEEIITFIEGQESGSKVLGLSYTTS